MKPAEDLLREIVPMIFVDENTPIDEVPAGVAAYQRHSRELLCSVVEERDAWQRRYYAAIGMPCPLDAPTVEGVPEPSTETI